MSGDRKEIPYTQILSVTKTQTGDTNKLAKQWESGFLLKTSDKEFKIMAPSEDERTLWLHTFNWIIKCTEYHKKVYEENVLEKRK